MTDKSTVVQFPESESDRLKKRVFRKASTLPILKILPRERLSTLFCFAKVTQVPKGTVVIQQGEEGSSIFILLSGAAAVYYEDPHKQCLNLAEFEEGDFFGEAAFFSGGTRNASINTTADAILLELEAGQVRMLMEEYPVIYAILFSRYEDRYFDLKSQVQKFLMPIRNYPRRRMEGEARFNLGGMPEKGGRQAGMLVNISPGGCKVELEKADFVPFQQNIVGRDIPLSITLTDETGNLAAVGKVVWFEHATDLTRGEVKVRFGVKFIRLLGDSERILSSVLNRGK